MTKKSLIPLLTAALCLVYGPLSAQDALVMYPSAREVVKVVVSAGHVEAFEAVAAVALKGAGKGEVVAEVDDANRLVQRVASQRVGDTLYVHVPGLTRPRTSRSFFVYLGVQDASPPGQVPAPKLDVAQKGGSIRITNDYYAIDMSPSNGTFFPLVGLPGSQALSRDIYLDDRLWDKTAEKKGHWLYKDRDAVVRLEQKGHLVAVFSIEAGYRHTDKGEAAARARYQYVCRAGSPLIEVSAVVKQPTERAWNELHFLHISHRGSAYPNWAMDRPRKSGVFVDDKKVWGASGWGVIHNGRLAVGLVKPQGHMTFHDNPFGFCEYVRDACMAWRSREQRFKGTLFIGPWHGVDETAQIVRSTSGLSVRPVAKLDRRALLEPRTPLGRWAAARKMKGLPQWPEPNVDIHVARTTLRRSGEWLLLHDARLAALFHERGGLMGLTDVTRGRDLFNAKESGQAWELEVGKAAEGGRWVSSRDAAPAKVVVDDSAKGQVLRFRWDKVATGLTVETEWRLDGSGLRGRLRTSGSLGAEGLLRVRFPDVDKLGTAKATDLCVPRGNWGRCHKAASGRHGGQYPSGYWPMQFLGITEGDESLYLGAEDGTAELKRFTYEVGKRFYFELIPPDLGVPGKRYDMGYDVVLSPLQGDWLAVGKRYREFALKQVWCSKGHIKDRADIPKRYRDGLYWFLMNGTPESVVPELLEARKRFPVPLGVHWYCWHVIPFDDDYPHYKPSKKGFKEAVKKLQDLGITVMPYINGRLWDSDTKDFPTVALPWATKDAKGQHYVEVYGSKQKLVPMCPYSKLWQDTMFDTVNWLYNDQGVDAVYMDQIGAASPRVCMDPRHGHPLGGGGWWLEGYTKMLTRIQALTDKPGPQRLLTTENNADPYIHLIDAFLVWNPRYPDMVPLYAAVYSDRRIAFVSRVEVSDSAMGFAMKVGRDFLWGTQLGWLGTWLLDQAHREHCDYMVTLAKARFALKEFLSYGEYLGQAQIECTVDVNADWVGHRGKKLSATFPAVMGALWQEPGRDRAIIATNFDLADHVVDVAIPQGWAEHGAREIDPLSSSPGSAPCTNGRAWRVLVPARAVRVLRFSPAAKPLAALAKWPSREIEAGAAAGVPDVECPTGKRLGTVLHEVLPSRAATLKHIAGTLRAGDVSEWELEYRVAPEDRGARLRVVLPDGAWAQPSAVFAPDPRTRRGKVRFLIRGGTRLKGGVHSVSVVIERELATSQLSALDPRKELRLSAARPVKVDADLGEWQDAEWAVLDGTQGNRMDEGKWRGPQDLSGKAAALTHGKTLYLAFEVTDDVHHRPALDRSIWRGDCIQIDFDPYLDSGAALDGNDIELAAALTDKGARLFFWTQPPGGAEAVAVQRRGQKTFYELALPVRYVTRGLDELSRVGFSFTLNDTDASGDFDGWLEWTPGICGSKNPAAFGLLCARGK